MVDFVRCDNVVRGHPSEVMPTIRKKVSALARWNDAIFIGKTSGYSGLADRFNNKYKALGYYAIVAIYETRSAAYADVVEDLAIEHGWRHYNSKVENCIGGGGGPDGEDPKKIVYVALKKYNTARRIHRRPNYRLW